MVFGVIILMWNLKQFALFDVIFYQIQHAPFIFGEIRIVNWVVILIEDITSMGAIMKTQNISCEKITVSFLCTKSFSILLVDELLISQYSFYRFCKSNK